jgi:parvulin-like peptidyl-prolyl isomerase
LHDVTLLRLLLLAFVAAIALPACGGGEDEAPAYAARVGDTELSEDEVAGALSALPPGLDSAAARQQVIEQWVTAELLAQEARRRGLQTEPDVQSTLAESERAVLGAALVEHFFAANPGSPTDEELAAYFSENRDDLALREPYVRVRHLRARTNEDAETARASLARAGTAAFADSLWRMVAREYADDPDGALAMSATHMPESRYRAAGDVLAETVSTLAPGQAAVVPVAGVFHVIQLVDRRPAGTPARLEWVRDDLRERIAIDRRYALLARQVQSLRTEAMAARRLDVPGTPASAR